MILGAQRNSSSSDRCLTLQAGGFVVFLLWPTEWTQRRSPAEGHAKVEEILWAQHFLADEAPLPNIFAIPFVYSYYCRFKCFL